MNIRVEGANLYKSLGFRKVQHRNRQCTTCDSDSSVQFECQARMFCDGYVGARLGQGIVASGVLTSTSTLNFVASQSPLL